MKTDLRPLIKIDESMTINEIWIKALCSLRAAGLNKKAIELDDKMKRGLTHDEGMDIMSEFVSFEIK